MSAVVPLHQMASAVVVRTLLDHNDQHSPSCRTSARSLIAKLRTNLYTAISEDLLRLFVDSYPRLLPAFLLPVLAPPHLRVLSLKRCCVVEEDSKTEFKYLRETLKRCCRLHALELDGCNLVLPLQLCDIITLHAPQLVSVSVEECRGISNEFVQKLLRGLPNLSHLNISICPEVTDNVFALSEMQGLLEERDGAKDTNSGGCNLSSVDLSGNQQLTSTCIRHLTELCGPRLRSLNVAATRMDCTILWFLSGYSLSTAVQLAAEANRKNVTADDTSAGETLAQLITEFRVLQEKLKSLQEDECQRLEEGSDGVDGKPPKEGGVGASEGEDVPVVEDERQEDQRVEAGTGSAEDCRTGKDETERKEEDQTAGPGDDENKADKSGESQEELQKQEWVEEAREAPGEDTRARKEEIEGKEEVQELGWCGESQTVAEGQREGKTPGKDEQPKQVEGVRGAWEEDMGGGAEGKARKDEGGMDRPWEDADGETEGPIKNETPTLEEHLEESIDDVAVDLYVTDIIDGCKKRLLCEGNPHACTCGHSQDQNSACNSLTQITHQEETNTEEGSFCDSVTRGRKGEEKSKGNLCHACLAQAASNVCQSVQTDSASDSDRKSSARPFSANVSSDADACDEYSHKSGSSPNRTREATHDVCKLGQTDSTKGSGRKSLQPSDASSDAQDDKKAAVCPWRRLYTPCVTSLDMSIIDFDATLVVTCLKEFFLANRQLRKLTVCWKELTDSMLDIIAAGGTELQSLCLGDCSGLTSLGVAHLLSKCRNLRELDLQGVCCIADVALMPIFLHGDSCNLHSLKLSETNISDSTLARIAKYLGKKITTLEVSWCEEISPAGMAEVAAHCPALQTLTLRQCSMDTESLMALAWNCTGLTSLNMSGVENLTDGVVQAMMPSLRRLKTLDISWNSELTDAAISSVLCCCPLLVELYLMGLKRITEKSFMPIISELARWQRCKKLIKLKMKERALLKRLGEEHLSSDEEYEDLISPLRSTTYAPCLRTLELPYCDRVNDDLLGELVAICVGTLSIIDYYGIEIKAKLMKMNSCI